MDIQELVDARIRHLSKEQAHGGMRRVASSRQQNSWDEESLMRLAHAGSDEASGKGGLADTFDAALSKISNSVLEISEQVSGDYARLEQDMLKSRLALLRSAEMVIDMAISLKRYAREVLPRRTPVNTVDLDFDDRWRDAHRSHMRRVDDPLLDGGRASMHTNGLADLFRKT